VMLFSHASQPSQGHSKYCRTSIGRPYALNMWEEGREAVRQQVQTKHHLSTIIM
jgi:hypothetical protein